ncbi:hypothetical protein [Nitrosomonas sp. Nm33]|uniref:hypothetical protein n=1 Tax=Nitrosomonas sp. Nm33 TaxID=133724 RepID=UPI00115FDFF9|nr:hypothetical protein [Nitrosomonas sp. Nm33]
MKIKIIAPGIGAQHANRARLFMAHQLDGTVKGWQSVDGVMDCVDAANQIMLCQQAGYDSVGPCRCTQIGSHCNSIFSEVACMFACWLSNAGQTGGGEPGGGEDAMQDRKLKTYIRQRNEPSLK